MYLRSIQYILVRYVLDTSEWAKNGISMHSINKLLIVKKKQKYLNAVLDIKISYA